MNVCEGEACEEIDVGRTGRLGRLRVECEDDRGPLVPLTPTQDEGLPEAPLDNDIAVNAQLPKEQPQAGEGVTGVDAALACCQGDERAPCWTLRRQQGGLDEGYTHLRNYVADDSRGDVLEVCRRC